MISANKLSDVQSSHTKLTTTVLLVVELVFFQKLVPAFL